MGFIVPHTLPPDLPADRSLLEVVGRFVPPARVQEAVAATAPAGSRRRKLPGEVLLLLFVAMHLMPLAALDTVLTTLLAGTRLRSLGHDTAPATESGISHARYRWGVRPLVQLFHAVCRPLAVATTRGAWLEEHRLMAIDTSLDDVADTPANARAFGRPAGERGQGSYPQIMGAHLIECGTHAIIDAGFWPRSADVHRAARRLVRSVTADMLVLVDRGLATFALTQAIRQRSAHVLFRIPSQQTVEPVQVLPDGSLLAVFHAVPPSRRTTTSDRLLVRVITYTLHDPARVGHRTRHRLLTTLLDHRRFPARRLIAAYHERWEIELAYDEMGTHQRLASEPLRAKRPVGVLQEAYGLLLAHYLVRAVMHDAALAHDLDPDRLSFVHALRLVHLLLPVFQLLDPSTHAALSSWLLAEIARFQLPARSLRIAPRACKRPRSKHRLRRQVGVYRTIRVRPFDEIVVLLPADDQQIPLHQTA